MDAALQNFYEKKGVYVLAGLSEGEKTTENDRVLRELFLAYPSFQSKRLDERFGDSKN